MTDQAGSILSKHWGYTTFRGSQENIISTVMEGSDVLALLPTGGGKSVCYQIPAILKEGICIVISPLIALIQDQVAGLKNKDIKAIGLTGGMHFEEVSTLLDNCLYGNYKFIYLSPERLQQEFIQERIARMHVNLIAIDEAHCISQWGNDFRPAYLNCGVLKELHPNVPVIALTATATQRVAKDIIENLGLENAAVFKDSFSRVNIAYKVVTTDDKRYELKHNCTTSGKSGIIYVRTRRAAEELSTFLNKNNISAAHFHGGISKSDKISKLQSWLTNKIKFMVATNAFGMGVDKPDVSLIIHYHIPDSLENYFQESGRAGRDGNAAKAMILINANDETQLKRQFLNSLPDVPFLKLLYKKMNAFFQIPYGTLDNEIYQFKLDEFCEIYKLNTILVYNGLKVLDQNSVIALTQSFSQQSVVRFLASKNVLFKYLDNNRAVANPVQVILRTYGGIFDFDTKINTLLIANKAGLSEPEVLTILDQLHKDQIIAYEPKHSDLEIAFLVPREDELTINAFAPKVKLYQKIKQDNVNSMLAYIKNTKKCRNRQLLHYFGEVKSENCGKCDVCLSQFKVTDEEDKEIKRLILNALQHNKSTSKKLIAQLPFEGSDIIKALQGLLEDSLIGINAQNEYILK